MDVHVYTNLYCNIVNFLSVMDYLSSTPQFVKEKKKKVFSREEASTPWAMAAAEALIRGLLSLFHIVLLKIKKLSVIT